MISIKRFSVILSMLSVLFVVPATAVVYAIKVACYYEVDDSPAKSGYDYLKFNDGTDYYTNATVKKLALKYLVPPGMQEGLENACREQLALKGEKHKLSSIKGTSYSLNWLSRDWIGKHLDILDSDYEEKAQAAAAALLAARQKAAAVLETIEEKTIAEYEITEDEPRSTKTHNLLLETLESWDLPTKTFLSEVTLKDFPRNDVEIRATDPEIADKENQGGESEVTSELKFYYSQVHGMIKRKESDTPRAVDDKSRYATDPFEILEMVAVEQNPRIDRLALRKNIARAFHTQTQEYELRSFKMLFEKFLPLNSEDPNNLFVHPQSGRPRHKIILDGTTLVLKTVLIYNVDMTKPASDTIGLVEFERVLEMDLITGKFSKERLAIINKLDVLK